MLSALGHVTDSPPDLLAAASSNVIAAMRAHGDRRLVVLAPPSVEDQQDRRGLCCRFVRLAMPVMMRAATRDHKAQSRLVKDSGLDWTIARGAGVFTDGPHTGRYHAGPITPAADRRVSRADLADLMLAAASNGKVRAQPAAGEPMTPRSSTELKINDNIEGEIPCPDAQSHA